MYRMTDAWAPFLADAGVAQQSKQERARGQGGAH